MFGAALSSGGGFYAPMPPPLSRTFLRLSEKFSGLGKSLFSEAGKYFLAKSQPLCQCPLCGFFETSFPGFGAKPPFLERPLGKWCPRAAKVASTPELPACQSIFSKCSIFSRKAPYRTNFNPFAQRSKSTPTGFAHMSMAILVSLEWAKPGSDRRLRFPGTTVPQSTPRTRRSRTCPCPWP